MNHHERESFIYRIRSGKVKIESNIFIIPPTIDQIVESYNIYHETYDQCVLDGIMTEDDMIRWMKENLIWTKYNENLLEQYKKEIEELKIDIYTSRQDPKKCINLKHKIRNKENLLADQLNLKNSEYNNTCEGISTLSRINWLISQTTINGSNKYNFDRVPLHNIIAIWEQSLLSESNIRELARNEPWRSMWITHKNLSIPLFLNRLEQELTTNQKNIVIWSQIYDNAHESLECPENLVFNDDDMFDGWMIMQHKKNEKQKTANQIDEITKNSKIKNSSEVLVMANNQDHAQNIHKLNSPQAMAVINSRFNAAQKHGSISYEDLPDTQQEIYLQTASNMKNALK